MPLMSHIRPALLGLRLRDASFQRRKFHLGAPKTRTRLELVSKSFLVGCNMALEETNAERLAQTLDFLAPDLRGFAYEGAAMGLTMVDSLAPGSRGKRLDRFLNGPGAAFTYMCYVGAGLAVVALKGNMDRLVERMAGQSSAWCRWLVFDGAGFFRTYFHRNPAVERIRLPKTQWELGRRQFDAGAGRALWFRSCGDPVLIDQTIARYPLERRGPLWAGVGLACAYAGGVPESAVVELAARAGAYNDELALGVALAVNTRHLGGNLVPNQEMVASVVWKQPTEVLHKMVEEVKAGLVIDAAGQSKGRPGLGVMMNAIRDAAARRITAGDRGISRALLSEPASVGTGPSSAA